MPGERQELIIIELQIRKLNPTCVRSLENLKFTMRVRACDTEGGIEHAQVAMVRLRMGLSCFPIFQSFCLLVPGNRRIRIFRCLNFQEERI